MHPKRRLITDESTNQREAGKISREEIVSSTLDLQNRQDGIVNQEASFRSAERRARDNKTHNKRRTDIILSVFQFRTIESMNASHVDLIFGRDVVQLEET